MRKNKVALLMVLVLVLSLSFATIANAGALCECGGNIIYIGTTYTPWINIAPGEDERTKTVTWRCTDCGEETINVQTEYRYDY